MAKSKEAPKLPRGWGQPGGSRKFHFFPDGNMQSLCAKWAYTGERFDDNDESQHNCAACKKLVPKYRGEFAADGFTRVQ